MGPSRPQSPAVRGFPRIWNRSLRCTLRGAFAVLGEREGHKPPCGSRLFKVDVPQAISKTVIFNRSKKCFLCSGDFQRRSYIFCAAVVNEKASWPFENRTAVTKEERLRQRKNCAAIVKDKAAQLRDANDNFLITISLFGSFVALVTVLFVVERG